jgi:hypothetical protein
MSQWVPTSVLALQGCSSMTTPRESTRRTLEAVSMDVCVSNSSTAMVESGAVRSCESVLAARPVLAECRSAPTLNGAAIMARFTAIEPNIASNAVCTSGTNIARCSPLERNHDASAHV